MTNHEENFLEFHQANPHVYELFKKYCNAAFKSGRSHYSAYAIFERIRWHQDIETNDDLGFKLNNNHRPYYSRLYQLQFPNRAKFFRTRTLTSKRNPYVPSVLSSSPQMELPSCH
jgi:hypothetical protein